MMTRRLSILALSLCAAALLTPFGAAAQEMRLRLAHVFPEITSVGEAANEFARLVGERTGGRIEVSVFPAGQLGGDDAIGRELSRGTLDLAFVNPNSLVGLDPLFDFHILPYVASSYEAADAIFYRPDGIVQATLNETLERHGMKALGYFENDFRTISNSQREVRSPADLDDLKLRVVPSQSLKLFFEKAGATVVILPFPELFTSLQQGAVDGQENGVNLTYQSRFYETQGFVTISNHSYVMSTITASQDLLDRLSPEDAQVFMDTAREVGERQVADNREVTQQAIDAMQEAGVSITTLDEAEMAAFRALGEQVWEEMTPVYGAERMQALRDEIAGVEAR